MKEVDGIFSSEIEIKKSKFISFILPVGEFEKKLEELKKLHTKARHFVWAYRKMENNGIIEKFSDAAEPKNSAGKPTLAVLVGEDIINAAIITIRYFGGIKLGIGGLIRAYTLSAKEVIKKASFKEFIEKEIKEMELDYKTFNGILPKLKKNGVIILEQKFEELIKLKLLVPKKDMMW